MTITVQQTSGGLSERQLAQFDEQGFLLVEDLVKAADMQPLFEDYEQVLERLCAQLLAAGKITSMYTGLPFAERYLEVCRETGRVYAQNFNISYPPLTDANTPANQSDAVFKWLCHEKILNAVESLIGPEIELSPVGNMRAKPPERILTSLTEDDNKRHGIYRQTPWHQDNGIVTEDADATDMLTVWIPLTDAPVEAGCLEVIPGSHHGELLTHCPLTGELIIPDKLLPTQQPVALPMKPGDALFLHRRLCHHSLRNVGNTVRWSCDLRYQPAGQPSGRGLPSFLVRSRANPEAVVRDYDQWRATWQQARASLIAGTGPPRWNRWSADAVICA